MNQNRLIRKTEAAKLLGVAKSTLWRLSKQPGFPEEIQITKAIKGWMLSDLIDWLETNKKGNGQT